MSLTTMSNEQEQPRRYLNCPFEECIQGAKPTYHHHCDICKFVAFKDNEIADHMTIKHSKEKHPLSTTSEDRTTEANDQQVDVESQNRTSEENTPTARNSRDKDEDEQNMDSEDKEIIESKGLADWLPSQKVDGDEEEFTDDKNQVDWFQQESGNNLATPFMILSYVS